MKIKRERRKPEVGHLMADIASRPLVRQRRADRTQFRYIPYLIGNPRKPCGVEERRGGLGPMGITPFPLPAHQTGRADFPHPASRPASPQSTRRGAKMDPTQSDHTELPEHDPIGETPGAARRHLVAPDQEMTNSLVDRVVDGPVSRHSRPMVEVRIPTHGGHCFRSMAATESDSSRPAFPTHDGQSSKEVIAVSG